MKKAFILAGAIAFAAYLIFGGFRVVVTASNIAEARTAQLQQIEEKAQ